MSYWTFNGKNGLQGVEGTYEVLDDCPGGRTVFHPDPFNPAVLRDDEILYAIRTSRYARADFKRIFPTLLPEEQALVASARKAN